jgi:hypothetical protein
VRDAVFLLTRKPGLYERFGFKTTDTGMYRFLGAHAAGRD